MFWLFVQAIYNLRIIRNFDTNVMHESLWILSVFLGTFQNCPRFQKFLIPPIFLPLGFLGKNYQALLTKNCLKWRASDLRNNWFLHSLKLRRQQNLISIKISKERNDPFVIIRVKSNGAILVHFPRKHLPVQNQQWKH